MQALSARKSLGLPWVLQFFAIAVASHLAPAQDNSTGAADTFRRTEGTVNVLLANSHGLVLVTDSQLSSSGRPQGSGQKLLKIDDHTLCSIAGWYSNSGPTQDGLTRPASTIVPRVINRLVNARYLEGRSFEGKLEAIARAVAFQIGVVDQMASIGGIPSGSEGSVITLATFEDSKIKVAQARLTRVLRDGRISYDPTFDSPTTIGPQLTYKLAGITDLGEKILNRSLLAPGDPIISYYDDSISANKGSEMSIVDMLLTAKVVAFATHRANPGIVGWPLQLAKIENGKAEVIQQPFESGPSDHPLDGTIEAEVMPKLACDEERKLSEPFTIGAGLAALVHDGDLSCAALRLDNRFYFRSRFEHCLFLYSGSLNFIFDKSNVVIDSFLRLAPGVDPNLPVVRKLLSDFPGLKLEP